MGSDLARITFDPERGYRSVVAQQGRVTLEADINEEALIAGEALRLETIDVIGPAGTPEADGYQVSIDAKGIVVAPGTMYVGGWRMALEEAVFFDHQPEWLDQPEYKTKEGNAIAALLVTEQAISAVEDQALLEVALGGPDTAARTRLMQHFLLIPTKDSRCDAAEKGLRRLLEEMGMDLDPKTLEVLIVAQLKVSFFPPTQPSDPCCPPSQGGYLGADNQLVRVAISSFSSPNGTLLWGWNNASFLYRAAVVSPQVLQLSPSPIDAAHTPQPGQVIEILRTTMILGDPDDQNFVAAPEGLIVALGSGTIYDPSTQQLTLPPGASLPDDPHTLFVRLWQGQVPFTSGAATQLDAVSGLAVTIDLQAFPEPPFSTRPFWCFAVRPNTPQSVYPERFLQRGQPPTGPRQWLCDLAIVERVNSEKAGSKVVADCRNHFKPLIDEEDCSCCNLTISPADDWMLQLSKALESKAKAISLCFQPGTYEVANTIVFTRLGVKMTGAGEATVLTGRGLEVVLQFESCPNVCLSDITVVAGTAGYSNNAATAGLQGAVTLRSCAQADIERVFLECEDAELRAASCLAVYNPVGSSDAAPLRFNLRVLNSQFRVGHFQVGILVVNGDRVQIEGNVVATPSQRRKLDLKSLAENVYLAGRLRKQMLHSLTIVETAPAITKNGKRRMRRLNKAEAGAAAPVTVNKTEEAAGERQERKPAAEQPISVTSLVLNKLPPINLGTVGRSHITSTYGTLKLQFVSSNKLSNAWTEALAKSGLNEHSTARQVHNAVHAVADAAFLKPNESAPAFSNYLSGLLPNLYSTSAQGIVVAGNIGRDIRILNNTVDGTAQGIHVGWSDRKANPYVSGLQAQVVQICGNTINIRLTAEMTGDRHGIFVGCVQSALINDNHVQLFREPNAGQDIFGVKVVGVFGPRLLIERNAILGFSYGLYTDPSVATLPQGDLWKASDNVSTSVNVTSCFKAEDNVP